MARHNELGRLGEQIAAEYLIKKGYTIRDSNWRWQRYEIDIVCEHNGRIVIVEVKTRTSGFIEPADAITRHKMLYLVKAANVYVKLYNLRHEIQFDVVTIVGREPDFKINHIEDAFYAPAKTYR